ncbi:hypothetical protein BDA96_06G026200 [Sorghum bicolor]|uniref:Uncharacterized protein n=2 Tax=Sorghum bicolor TaxID=4558 RepID=A0A921QN28_SORBI|nr:hypothetical protein BDA96_06G026200 [Sorghum bicolor]KXG25875.1 hypothetical protein SORBI_3006G024800 [Sorghum bicolor]
MYISNQPKIIARKELRIAGTPRISQQFTKSNEDSCVCYSHARRHQQLHCRDAPYNGCRKEPS